jgi:hypothetical protein
LSRELDTAAAKKMVDTVGCVMAVRESLIENWRYVTPGGLVHLSEPRRISLRRLNEIPVVVYGRRHSSPEMAARSP